MRLPMSMTEMLVVDALNKAYDGVFIANAKYGAMAYDIVTTDHCIGDCSCTKEEKEQCWKMALKYGKTKEERTEHYKTQLLYILLSKVKEKGIVFSVIVDKERKEDIIINFHYE